MAEDRESFPLDVLFVGGGPASLAGAIHLAQLVARHNASAGQAAQPVTLEIGIIEKAREFGQHGLSGAVLNPVALKELIPDYLEKGCPVSRRIEKDAFYFLTSGGHVKVPGFLVPPGDPAALADRLLRLVGDEGLRRALAARARERVREGFTFAAQAEAYARLFTALAGAGVGAGAGLAG